MTRSNPLRVGLIGAGGRWGPRAHVPVLKDVPEAELYTVCTAHADTAQAAAEAVAVRVPAHYGLCKNGLAAPRRARLSVHARADPAGLRRRGAIGEYDADGPRRGKLGDFLSRITPDRNCDVDLFPLGNNIP